MVFHPNYLVPIDNRNFPERIIWAQYEKALLWAKEIIHQENNTKSNEITELQR